MIQYFEFFFKLIKLSKVFGYIKYSVAYAQGNLQNSIMDEVMALPEIEKNWESEEIMNYLVEKSKQFNFQV